MRPSVLSLLLLLAATPVAADEIAPLLGQWRGEVGSDLERVVVLLEVERGEEGRPDVRMTLPVANFDRMPLRGFRLVDGRLVHPGMPAELVLQDGELHGEFMRGQRARLVRDPGPLPTEAAPPSAALPGPTWTTRLNGLVFASPVQADGVVYIGSTGGVVNALDANDGSLRWARGIGWPVHGAVAVDSDAIYVASDGGLLHRLAREDGEETWRVAIDTGPAPRVLPHPTVFDWDWQGPQPLLVGGKVVVGGAGGTVHAVDASTGASLWTFDTEGRIRHGAAAAGSRVFVASEAGQLHALDLASGAELWRYEIGGKPGAGLVVADGRVYVAGRDARLHAVDAETGEAAWRLGFWSSWVEAAPIVHEGVLYVGSSDMRRVTALDPATGQVHWRSPVGGWTWGRPLPLGDQLVVGMAGGAPYFLAHAAGLALLDRASGRVLARWDAPEGSGHQWGIAGDVIRAGDTLVAAGIEGVVMGFALPDAARTP